MVIVQVNTTEYRPVNSGEEVNHGTRGRYEEHVEYGQVMTSDENTKVVAGRATIVTSNYNIHIASALRGRDSNLVFSLPSPPPVLPDLPTPKPNALLHLGQ